jgi:hypothetical protein
MNKECKVQSESLQPCPFCGGEAKFVTDKSKHIVLQHFPEAGVCCPARYDQFCDSFEQGKEWWNTRAFHPAGYGDVAVAT